MMVFQLRGASLKPCCAAAPYSTRDDDGQPPTKARILEVKISEAEEGTFESIAKATKEGQNIEYNVVFPVCVSFFHSPHLLGPPTSTITLLGF